MKEKLTIDQHSNVIIFSIPLQMMWKNLPVIDNLELIHQKFIESKRRKRCLGEEEKEERQRIQNQTTLDETPGHQFDFNMQNKS